MALAASAGSAVCHAAILVLQKRNARTLGKFCDDAERLVVQPDALEHFQNFLNVVAVNVLRTRQPKASSVSDKRRHRGQTPVAWLLAEAVIVHDGNQIVELVNARERHGFPHCAFGDFAVAEQT